MSLCLKRLFWPGSDTWTSIHRVIHRHSSCVRPFIHCHYTPSLIFLSVDMEGGAIADVPNNATAYAHRNALYNICGYGIHPFLPFPDTVISFLTGCMDTIRKTTGRTKPYGVYPGYVDPLLPADEWAEAYWGENYPRLQEIKTKYDPNELFRNPQSVQPLST